MLEKFGGPEKDSDEIEDIQDETEFMGEGDQGEIDDDMFSLMDIATNLSHFEVDSLLSSFDGLRGQVKKR